MTKLCKQGKLLGCGRTLDISLFYRNGEYYQNYCKSCMLTYQKAQRHITESKAQKARSMCNKLIKEHNESIRKI